MNKNALTAILSDSEAGKSLGVIAGGLGLITTLSDPKHQVIVFGICAALAAIYGIQRVALKVGLAWAKAKAAETLADLRGDEE